MRVQLLLATKVVRAVKLLRYDDNLLAVQHVVDDVVLLHNESFFF